MSKSVSGKRKRQSIRMVYIQPFRNKDIDTTSCVFSRGLFAFIKFTPLTIYLELFQHFLLGLSIFNFKLTLGYTQVAEIIRHMIDNHHEPFPASALQILQKTMPIMFPES